MYYVDSKDFEFLLNGGTCDELLRNKHKADQCKTVEEQQKPTKSEGSVPEMEQLSLNAPFVETTGSLTARKFCIAAKLSQYDDLKYMPEILGNTISTLKSRFKGCSINSITNISLVKIAQVLTTKRIMYREHENTGFPNHYAFVFITSGFGKDKMSDDIDKYLNGNFRDWFKNESEGFKEKRYAQIVTDAYNKFESDAKRQAYIEEERGKVRNVILEVADGTREGLFEDAKAFQEADCGSIFVKNAEFGSYLCNATTEQKLFINQLFEAYSGKIISKCIKGGRREHDIEGLPVNAFLYSDPTLFEKDLKKPFNTLMETGLGRRSIITFQNKKEPYEFEQDAQKALLAEQEYYKNLKNLGRKLFALFLSVEKGAVYELTEETYCKVFHPFKITLENLENAESNTLLCKEIKSRELKALKLSCLYACLNHPKDLFIHPEDMHQAIATIEMLSADFKAFLNHRPKYNDKYDLLFNFFLENEGKEFTKTELVTNHYQKFGSSRDKFRDNFGDCIDTLREIAAHKGYYLDEKSINRNSGTSYSLVRIEPKELSDHVIPLENLINTPANP